MNCQITYENSIQGVKLMKVGMDAGGSLVKIVYKDNNQMYFKKFSIDELEAVISWLKMVAPGAAFSVTGGKSHLIKKRFLPDSAVVPEFQATCEGARFILLNEGKNLEQPFLLVNIGTGTSWHVVHGERYERILGSGIGGGTFTGLGELLTEEKDFHQLVLFAEEGKKGDVDLLVRDIYESEGSPIDGNLTAANFAKGTQVKHTIPDRMASLANMIAETIVLLTHQAAAIHNIKEVIYIGSTLCGNPPLQNWLEKYSDMLGLTSRFLNNGEYCGAVGAYVSV